MVQIHPTEILRIYQIVFELYLPSSPVTVFEYSSTEEFDSQSRFWSLCVTGKKIRTLYVLEKKIRTRVCRYRYANTCKNKAVFLLSFRRRCS